MKKVVTTAILTSLFISSMYAETFELGKIDVTDSNTSDEKFNSNVIYSTFAHKTKLFFSIKP